MKEPILFSWTDGPYTRTQIIGDVLCMSLGFVAVVVGLACFAVLAIPSLIALASVAVVVRLTRRLWRFSR